MLLKLLGGKSIRNTIFMRLVLMFLMIFLPVYLIGFGIYNWGANAVREQISNYLSAQVSFYSYHQDTEIEGIRLMQYQIMNDASLNELVAIPQSMSLYKKLTDELKLQDVLMASRNGNPYIADISVSIPTLNLTVSAINGMSALDQNKLETLSKANRVSRSQLMFYEGKLYLYAELPIVRTGSFNMPQMAIETELSDKAFLEVLQQFNPSEDGGTVLFNSKNGAFFDSASDSLGQAVMREFTVNEPTEPQGVVSAELNRKKYLLVYKRSETSELTLVRYMPEDKIYQRLKTFHRLFHIFTIASVFIFLLFAASSYDFIHKPLTRLVKAFRTAEQGELSVRINHKRHDEFNYLYRRFNEMVQNLDLLIEQVYKQKILTQGAELKQLQSQINPHFLYNTYFVLYSMAKAEDYDNVLYFLKQLGGYFQYITRTSAAEVTLEKEMDHARTYVEIQLMRFTGRVSVTIDEINPEWRSLEVPRLIIQPIIENAFKYVLEDKLSAGLLSIHTSTDSDGRILNIIIEDNGNGLTAAEMKEMESSLNDDSYDGETTGIINIHRRLRLKYGGESGISLSASELGGLKVTMSLFQKEGTEHV